MLEKLPDRNQREIFRTRLEGLIDPRQGTSFFGKWRFCLFFNETEKNY